MNFDAVDRRVLSVDVVAKPVDNIAAPVDVVVKPVYVEELLETNHGLNFELEIIVCTIEDDPFRVRLTDNDGLDNTF